MPVHAIVLCLYVFALSPHHLRAIMESFMPEWIHSEWVHAHQTEIQWLGALSIVTFVGSLIVIPLLVVRIPTDYFTRSRLSSASWRIRHPVLRLLLLILKNVLGLTFVLAGIAMLVLPGQGVITILIGISLLNFPGKRKLELRIIQQPAILRAINWMRAKSQHPPLQVPPRTVSMVEPGQ